MAIVRAKLSASTNGQPIGLATNAATTIHTSTTAASTSDEAHVWYVNTGATAVTGWLSVGATGSVTPFPIEIPAYSGMYLVAPGIFLASGIVLGGYAGGSGVQAYGFVNRLTTGA